MCAATAGDRPRLPSVREVLRLPEVIAGDPHLVAGEAGLDREVRWAHVVAGVDAVRLLDGHELVLTTGAGWPRDPGGLSSLAESIATVGGDGVAAILLELNDASGFETAPSELVRACAAHGVPLIELHRETRFVQITQRVHQRVLADQTEALQAREAVHHMLTELGLNRSPVDYVVEQLAETLRAAVVLEDSAHRVVAWSNRELSQTEEDHRLAPWASGGEPSLPPSAERVPVEAQGRRWGYLTALPGPAHPAGRRTVLELGAFALALGRLADTNGEQWLQLRSKRVFDMLLGGRYRNDTELGTQLAAAGLPLAGRIVFAATLRGTGDFGAHSSLQHAIVETALRRAVAPEGYVLIADDDGSSEHVLLALISLPENDARLGFEADHRTPTIAARLSRELNMLVPGTTPGSWRTHLSLGVHGHSMRQLVASLDQLRAAGRVSPSTEIGRVSVQQAARQPLAHLIRALSSTPEMQQFTNEVLGPVIDHDRSPGPGHTGDLLRVLAAYTAHPANRSLAAQQAMLSRSVFYQRLDLIEQLLGVDLADGETVAALTVALLARG